MKAVPPRVLFTTVVRRKMEKSKAGYALHTESPTIMFELDLGLRLLTETRN